MSRRVRSLSWSAAVVAFDQSGKLAVHLLDPACRPSWVAPVANPDAALGLVTQSGARLEILGTLLVGGAILFFFNSQVGRRYPPSVVGMLLGGATANIIDRLLHHEVLDYLVTPIAVVNIADIALTIGICALFWMTQWRRPSAVRTWASDPS